jgi:hypothetical protein
LRSRSASGSNLSENGKDGKIKVAQASSLLIPGVQEIARSPGDSQCRAWDRR